MKSDKGPSVRPKLKILIVDDMPNVVESMKKVLAEIGFKKVEAETSAQKALNLIIQEAGAGEPFDLIISDINMPGMNGLKLLEKIKSNPNLKKTHVFMVTTRNETEVVLKAIEHGASNYLIKPFDTEKVKDKIMAIFYPNQK